VYCAEKFPFPNKDKVRNITYVPKFTYADEFDDFCVTS
jgi:hypothetical protein